jgi:membrane protease YdiL (CAAX protease family)
MRNPLFNKGFSGLGQLGILMLLVGGGLVIGSLIAVGAWMGLTGGSMTAMPKDMLNPANAGPIKIVQAISTLFAFFIPAAGFAFICFRNGWDALGFQKSFVWKLAGISLLIIVCSGPLIDSLTTINKQIPISASAKAFFDKMEKAYEEQVKAIADVKSVSQFLLSIFMIAILPAVFEEVLFRGALQGLLQRWWKNGWLAIIVTSIIFSAIHGSWYGFIPRIALGMLLGTIFFVTQNLWYSILVHLANNAAVVSYMFYLQRSGQPVSVASEPSFPVWAGLVALAVLVVLFRWLRKSTEQVVPQEIFYEPTNPFDDRDTVA